MYDIKPGGIKWAYPIESHKKFAKPKKLSDSTEYKYSFQARQILYADKANLSQSEYDRLAKKKPIKVSNQEMALLRTQRKTEYSNLDENDIPIIDFFRIGDYRIVNNGFLYYIRNSGTDNFTVVMRKQIVPDVRRITREVIKDENRNNDATTDQSAGQERGERGPDRSSGERTGNGRELSENDGRNVQSGESQRDLHSGQGDADSRTLKLRRIYDLSARIKALEKKLKSDRFTRAKKNEYRRELRKVREEVRELVSGRSDRLKMSNRDSASVTDVIGSLYNYNTVNFDKAVVDFNLEHFEEQWKKGYYSSVVDTIAKQTGKSKREVWGAFSGILMRSEGIAKVDGKTFINVHELNESNLRKAFELGGLAAPSIGILDVDKCPLTSLRKSCDLCHFTYNL